MIRLRSLFFLGLWALACAPLMAAPSEPEKLAGDDDKALPTAQPTAVADERSQVQVTRSAKAASAFDLPAFVVTGSGERKALAARNDLGLAVDTSGGIKASPGEAGAGKDQTGAGVEREGYSELTETSRSFVGRLRGDGGLARGHDLDGMVAQELGQAFWWAQGFVRGSDGAPSNQSPWAPGQRSGRELSGRGGWRSGQGGTLALAGSAGADEAALSAQGTGSDNRLLQQQRYEGSLEWDGPLQRFGTGLKLQAGRGQAYDSSLLQGYAEDQAKAELRLEHPVQAFGPGTMAETLVAFEGLSQRWGGAQRSVQLLHAELWARFEAIPHQRIGLGLAVDGAFGDAHASQLGPRAALEQPLGPRLALRARVGSGLSLSRLGRDQDDQALRLPDASLPPGLWRLDGAASLLWQPRHELHADLEAFFKDGQGQFLPAGTQGGGVAVDRAVGSLRHWGLNLRQRWALGAWHQEAGATWQRLDLPDRAGWLATYSPHWSAYLRVGGRWKAWGLGLGVEALGERQAAFDGSAPLPAAMDLNAKLSYRYSEALDLYLRGSNLAAQPVQGVAGALDAAPYAGLGAEYRF